MLPDDYQNELNLPKKKVVAVIVTWNKRQQLLRCVHSILESSYPVDVIIVVDNASTDGTVQAIRRQFGERPQIQLVVNQVNIGGSGGFVTGIDVALQHQPNYLWLLDNDVVVAPDALSHLLTVFQQETSVGIVGSKIYFAGTPKIIWSFGARVNRWLGLISVVGDKVQDRGQYNQVIEVDYVPMCSMLVSSQVIDTIGSVDPEYFVYSDDVDFCTRAKRAGFRIFSAPGSVVWHDVTLNSQRMSSFAAYYFTRNYVYYFLQFSPWWYKPLIMLFLLAFLGRRLLATIKYWSGIQSFWAIEKATLTGFLDGWRGIRGKIY